MVKKILIVDDEERQQALLENYLRQIGFQMMTATTNREAFYLARQEQRDWIILDLLIEMED